MNHHDLFIKRLNAALKKQNITLNHLATLSDLKQSTLSNLRTRANQVPRLDTLYAIARGLNMSLTELLDFPPYNQRPDGSSPDQEADRWQKLGQALTADEKKRVWEILTGHDFPPYNEVEK